MIFNNSKVAVIGGDSRVLYAANAISAAGGECAVFANDAPISDPPDFTKAYSLSDALQGADLILLPIPCSRDGYTLSAPFSTQRISLTDIAKGAPKGATIFAGSVKSAFGKDSAKVIDYGESEFFASRNGALTAEGAISLAIDNSIISLLGSECCIFGFGRIGRALASYLTALGARVSVFARDKKDRAFIEHLGLTFCDYKNAHKELEDADYIFNTVPDKEIASLALHGVRASLIIDLAGQLASEGKIINGACLPSVYSPKSAGRLIAESVGMLLSEQKGGGAP